MYVNIYYNMLVNFCNASKLATNIYNNKYAYI